LLLVFVWIAVSVNMILSFTFGKLFRFSLKEIIFASNANIGEPSTAAAIAKGWRELIVPILLVGTLGYITLYKVPLQKKVEDCNWEHVHQ
jgi:uncharacterized membrane protein